MRADVACQTCHGRVERMPVVGADTGPALADDLTRLIGLHPPQRPLTMGWCVECHRRENAARSTQAPLDCIACSICVAICPVDALQLAPPEAA